MNSQPASNHPDTPNYADWTLPQPEELPQPTYWPVVMAAGLVLSMWSVVTSWATAVLGALLFIVSLIGWIRDLLHD